jgi:hypothetical protein
VRGGRSMPLQTAQAHSPGPTFNTTASHISHRCYLPLAPMKGHAMLQCGTMNFEEWKLTGILTLELEVSHIVLGPFRNRPTSPLRASERVRILFSHFSHELGSSAETSALATSIPIQAMSVPVAVGPCEVTLPTMRLVSATERSKCPTRSLLY